MRHITENAVGHKPAWAVDDHGSGSPDRRASRRRRQSAVRRAGRRRQSRCHRRCRTRRPAVRADGDGDGRCDRRAGTGRDHGPARRVSLDHRSRRRLGRQRRRVRASRPGAAPGIDRHLCRRLIVAVRASAARSFRALRADRQGVGQARSTDGAGQPRRCAAADSRRTPGPGARRLPGGVLSAPASITQEAPAERSAVARDRPGREPGRARGVPGAIPQAAAARRSWRTPRRRRQRHPRVLRAAPRSRAGDLQGQGRGSGRSPVVCRRVHACAHRAAGDRRERSVDWRRSRPGGTAPAALALPAGHRLLRPMGRRRRARAVCDSDDRGHSRRRARDRRETRRLRMAGSRAAALYPRAATAGGGARHRACRRSAWSKWPQPSSRRRPRT